LSPSSNGGSNRLERALEALLAKPPSTRAERDALLQRHPDLAEVLEPMLDGAPAELATSAAPERVLGDYRLVREIGRGGMGLVYEAWQRSLDRRVAVKVLTPALVQNASAVARFHREAAAAGRLRHPNLVEVYGFGSEAGEHFFAMQFVDGMPLHDVVERFRDPAAALALCESLADALAHAHAAGLVHRDVKPGNVLVRSDGQPLLTDFGVARDDALPTLTREGGFLGTLLYASPEQVRGEAVDARSDVWALGVILHELLAGAPPFAAPTEEATIRRILTEEPPRLQGRAGISDDLAAVVDRTLAKNRTQRYPSAAALRQDLRALRAGEPVTARLPTRIERMRRWARREPWRAVAAAALALGVPALAGVGGYLWANAPRIEAASREEARLAREELLAQMIMLGEDGDLQAPLAAARRLPRDDLEGAIVRALWLVQTEDREAARAELAGFAGATVELVRHFIDAPQASLPGDAPLPSDSFECYVRALILAESARHRGARSLAPMRRSIELLGLAIATSPLPRLAYYVRLAYAGDLADDAVAVRTADLGMSRHFPDSRVAREVRAFSLARIDPARTLALLDGIAPSTRLAAETMIARTLAFEHQDRLEEAVVSGRQAVDSYPDNGSCWNTLGNVLRKTRRTDEAIAALHKARELRPKHARFANSLGLAYRDAGKRTEARTMFEEAMALRIDYTPAALNLGNLLLADGDLAAAAEAFERVVAIDPGNARALANLGNALERAGHHEKALPFAIRATHVAPRDFIPHFNVAALAIELRLPKLALEYATRARELGEKSHHGLVVYAQALLIQEPLDGKAALAAAHAADRATKGKDAVVQTLLARAHAAAGDRDAGIELLRAARARFPGEKDRKRIDDALAALAKPD